MANPLSISDSLPRFEGEYHSAKKEFWKQFVVEVAIPVVIGLLVTLVDWKFGPSHIWQDILLPLLIAFVAAYGIAKYERYQSLPVNLLHDGYKDIRDRLPELIGLTNQHMWRALENTSTAVMRLGGDGEPWTPDTRFAVATSLIKGFSRIERYDATSTDSPYDTLEIAREFYDACKRAMKDAQVRRLLVFPRDTLLSELQQSDQRRSNLLDFIYLNHHGAGGGASRNRYILRYWPCSIKDLRESMSRHFAITDRKTADDNPVLADMAVLEGRLQSGLDRRHLLFGQVARATDTVKVEGHGMVKCGPIAPMLYRQWFAHVWGESSQKCEPAAQLAFWARLLRLRQQSVQRATPSAPDTQGPEFLKKLQADLSTSQTLCAVDIAPDPAMWFENPDYGIFHRSMMASAKAYPKAQHARVFVLPFCVSPTVAERFLKEIIHALVENGVDVFFHRKRDLVEYDLAAGDHITADNFTFYLTPLDEFTVASLSEAKNKAKGLSEMSLFRDQFNLLADQAKAWKYIARFSRFDEKDLINALATDI